MIGIDVVDMGDPLFKKRADAWRLIAHPDDSPSLAFWQSWSAKEAVFKTFRKSQPFSPKTIPIQLLPDGRFSCGSIQGIWKRHKQYWLAIAFESEIPLHFVMDQVTKNPSIEVREKLGEWFQQNSGIDTSIQADSQGLPILSHSKKPVSFSHHGRYLAAAFFP